MYFVTKSCVLLSAITIRKPSDKKATPRSTDIRIGLRGGSEIQRISRNLLGGCVCLRGSVFLLLGGFLLGRLLVLGISGLVIGGERYGTENQGQAQHEAHDLLHLVISPLVVTNDRPDHHVSSS
jgi:hypothetical protein